MQESLPPRRPAARKSVEKLSAEATTRATTGVALEADAHAMLARIAKKLKTKQTKFASAAIRNYAELGLDPRNSTVLIEGAKIRAEINEASHKMRKLTSEISTELTKKLHALEHDMYEFQTTQQLITMTYLARIEASLLTQQAAIQTQVLAPLLEQLIGVSVETHLNRTLLEELLLKFKDRPSSSAELTASSQQHDKDVTLRSIEALRRAMEAIPVEPPKLAVRPLLAKPVLRAALPDDDPVP
jgi:hypothetical protein